jgi:hypothetical protein
MFRFYFLQIVKSRSRNSANATSLDSCVCAVSSNAFIILLWETTMLSKYLILLQLVEYFALVQRQQRNH